MFDTAIKGFAAGLKSFLDFGASSSGRLKDEDLDTTRQIKETWQQVGQSMRKAMHTVEESPEYRQAFQDHGSYDPHQIYLNDEPKRSRSEKSAPENSGRSGFVHR